MIQRYRGGPAPYGWEVMTNGDFIRELPEEQTTIGIIRAARAEGLSLRRIAADLERDGRLSRTGRPWHPTQILRVLTRMDGAVS